MRARAFMIILAVIAVAAGALIAPEGYARLASGRATASVDAGRAVADTIDTAIQDGLPRPLLKAGPVDVDTPGYWSWALLDRTTKELQGSPNMTLTNSTESMIKAWIVSDFLRQLAAAGKEPTQKEKEQASVAIRDSNDSAAQALYRAAGGDAVVTRLIQMCGLTETRLFKGWWSRTQMSARDAVRMGVCIADGRAAGPRWTAFVLDEMRLVRGGVADQPPGFAGWGGGRWGIIDGLPADIVPTVAIKNGWTPIGADNSWHLNCLAVHEHFVLAVQARYPVSLGLAHGAGICRGVAQQLAQHAQTR